MADKPDVPDHLWWVWEAFWRLNRRRPRGFGGEFFAIPFTEIEGFMRVRDVAAEEWFCDLIEAMDLKYCDMQNTALAEKNKK